jgi:hypothetical protein
MTSTCDGCRRKGLGTRREAAKTEANLKQKLKVAAETARWPQCCRI